jgi:predicted DNA-binding transcriptional regulator AlpA
MRIRSVNTESLTGVPAGGTSRVTVTLSRWVNEPLPDIHAILCSHDLVRLTRRPRWELFGLALIGKFPRKKYYQGRPIGWCRVEVLEWMTRGLAVAPKRLSRLHNHRRCARRDARQQCLPLGCDRHRPSRFSG